MNLPLKATTQEGSVTAQLAEIITATTYESLDEVTVVTVKRLITDGVAVAVAGSKEQAPALVAEYVREMDGRPQASAWGYGFKTTPSYAAYVNAASMHVLELEPMSRPATQPLSTTATSAFALAEAHHLSGKDIIAACAKGIEVQDRILIAANHKRGALAFHTPGVVGALGSAVTASHLLRLNASQLVNALGIAASRSAGLWANSGSMVKCTHCGNAAAAGIEAATLALRGFQSNPAILEAPKGFVAVFFSKQFDYETLLAYGRPYRCVDPGTALKFYPSKHPTHFAIAAALELRPLIGDPANIAGIRVLTPEVEDADRPNPRSGLEGKFSFQYTIAAALLDGKVGLETFTDERRFRGDIVGLLEKISLTTDASLPRATTQLRVELEVTLKDGSAHKTVCTKPPGFWGEPINAEQHMAKLRDCLGARLHEPQIARTLELLGNLERLSSAEVAELIALLA